MRYILAAVMAIALAPVANAQAVSTGCLCEQWAMCKCGEKCGCELSGNKVAVKGVSAVTIEPGKCYPIASAKAIPKPAPTRITGCACDTLGTCICTWPGCQCPACASYRNEPAPVAPAIQPVYSPPVYYQLRPTFTPQSYFPPMQMRAGGRSC